MARLGYKIHIFSWDKIDSSSFYNIPDCVIWHRLGFKKGIFGKFFRLYSLIKLIKKVRPELFLGFLVAGNFVPLTACWFSGVKIVAAERNGPSIYWIKYSIFARWLAFLSLYFCQRIVVQFDEFKLSYPTFLQKKIITIPNAIVTDCSIPVREKTLSKGVKFLYVGRLERLQKQPQLLLEAFISIAKKDKHCTLSFVGDGQELDVLQSRVAREGLQRRVMFSTSTLNVQVHYSNADILVIPSLWEGSPNVVCEAMFQGLPVIGFNVDGVKQLIQHDKTGMIVSKMNSIELANVMESYILKPEKFVEHSNATIKEMRSHDSSDVSRAWQGLIRSI